MKTYIASPLFNEEQINNIKLIESLLESYGFQYFSPRNGKSSREFSAHMTYPENVNHDLKLRLARDIFQENTDELDSSQLVVACIDDRDTGTSWEVGYAYAKGTPIITCTFHDYGLNIMLQFASMCHCRSESTLSTVLQFISKRSITGEESLIPPESAGSILMSLSDPFTDDLE